MAKSNFDNTVWSLDSKIAINWKWIKRKKKLDLSYFIGKSNFMEDGTQNYLVFHPIKKYFKLTVITGYLSSWEYRGLSAESINPPTTSDNMLTLVLNYYDMKIRVNLLEVV